MKLELSTREAIDQELIDRRLQPGADDEPRLDAFSTAAPSENAIGSSPTMSASFASAKRRGLGPDSYQLTSCQPSAIAFSP